jgi:hypothetical protein
MEHLFIYLFIIVLCGGTLEYLQKLLPCFKYIIFKFTHLNSLFHPPVGIDNPPVPKTDTQKTENLDKAIFPLSREYKHVLTPTKQHTSTKWLTVAPPYIPDTVVPAPHLGFVQVKGSQFFPSS